jgi:hypothetical protein
MSARKWIQILIIGFCLFFLTIAIGKTGVFRGLFRAMAGDVDSGSIDAQGRGK